MNAHGWTTVRRGVQLGLVALLVGAMAAPALAGDKDKKHHHHSSRKDKKKPPPPPPDPEIIPADEPPPPPPKPEPPPGPWAEGVTPEQKAEAGRLLNVGNTAFLDGKLDEALSAYQEALKSWDHPAIRFNIVKVYIQQHQAVEAYANLELALKYGAAPLEETVYQEALNYKTLLEGQIADIEVSCAQQGVKVTLDGQPFVDCPGTKTLRLRAGDHQVVGAQEGFITLTQGVSLVPGGKKTVDVKLVAIKEAGVTKRRWANWKPWTVVIAGMVVGGVGGILQWQASGTMKDYERAIARECADTGCAPEDLAGTPTAALEDRALLENKIAIGMMAAGGAVVVTGAVLVFMNRQYTVYPESKPIPATPGPVAITPVVIPGGAALTASLRF